MFRGAPIINIHRHITSSGKLSAQAQVCLGAAHGPASTVEIDQHRVRPFPLGDQDVSGDLPTRNFSEHNVIVNSPNWGWVAVHQIVILDQQIRRVYSFGRT